jgi:hypothetical protein
LSSKGFDFSAETMPKDLISCIQLRQKIKDIVGK